MIVINNPTIGASSGGILVGSIVLWYGSASAVPYGYSICNGSGGTLDLRGKSVMGATNAGDLLSTGGSSVHLHSADSNTSSDGSHNHNYNSGTVSAAGAFNYGDGTTSTATYAAVGHGHSFSGGNTSSDGSHYHSVGGVVGLASSYPSHKKLYWIQRLL